jgi:hypothetical protein
MERSLRGAYAITLAALLLRTAYALSQRVLQGDTVQYVEVAQQVSRGSWAAVDPWWFTPFSLLLALLHALAPLPWIGLARGVCVAAGAATVLVIGVLGRRPFGDVAALAAAATVAVHPRMVQLSADGYIEALYVLLLVACGLAALDWRVPESGARPLRRGALLGLLLGALVTLRPESALLILLGLSVLAALEVRAAGGLTTAGLARDATAVLVAALLALAYTTTFGPRVQGKVLFGKFTAVLQSEPESPGNLRAVAKEGYVPGGIAFDPPTPPPRELLGRMLAGFPRQAALVPRAAAYALLHPLLPALAAAGVWLCRRRRPGSVAFAALLVLVPLAAYPLAHVVPRYLYQTVPWVALLAGLAVARSFERWPRRGARVALLLALLVPLVAGTVLLAAQRSSRGVEYRRLAHWIDARLGAGRAPEGLEVVTQAPELGLYSSAARRRILPWLADGCALAAWMRHEGLRWAALDRAYLTAAMPQYLPLVRSPAPPGFAVVEEIRSRDNVVRLLLRNDTGCSRPPVR